MHVIVLMGGESAERDISLQSGCAVADALESSGHQVTRVDPDETDLCMFNWPECDVIFIALHGTFGEDGQLQEILDKTNLPYTGSGATASRLAFHKSEAKNIFQTHNIPTPESVVFSRSTSRNSIEHDAKQLGYPLFIKPEAQGSSIGVSLLSEPQELNSAINLCLKYDSRGLIEKAITGSEWTLGLFGDIIFPLIQIKFNSRFYDHHAKYEDEATSFILDAKLSPAVKQKLISTGLNAYRAIGAGGVARVDIILDQHDQAWVLEVNTIPGMTSHSNIPLAAKKMGWSFSYLCEKICLAAIDSQSKEHTAGSSASNE